MYQCRFELNDKPMSAFTIEAFSVPAFSGNKEHANKRSSACLIGLGPIPPGSYYIFDRQGGGHLEWFRNLINDHGEWFALYAADGRIDDETLCDLVKRGHFRLHPRGPRGISQGCITVDRAADFQFIRTMLTSVRPSAVPGSALKCYGQVIVR